MVSIKEQIVEQLDFLPETILIQVVRGTVPTNGVTGTDKPTSIDNDPLVGSFAGSPDLAYPSEEILTEDIDPHSGWTWKTQS